MAGRGVLFWLGVLLAWSLLTAINLVMFLLQITP